MSFSLFSKVAIRGIAAVLPDEEICLDDEIMYYNNDQRRLKRFKKMLGLEKRRVAPEGVTSSDLCIQAATKLMSTLNYDPLAIDALIFITQTPDYIIPASSFVQHAALGLSADCAVFDVNLGCSGYVYGLWLASCMLESGARKRILLLAGDGSTGCLDKANRVVTPLFGDAGTATILDFDASAKPLSFSTGSDGKGYEAIIRPGGGARLPHLPAREPANNPYCAILKDEAGNPWTVGGYSNIWMDGKQVFDFSMEIVPGHIKNHLSHEKLAPQDIAYLILHQANLQIMENIALEAGFNPAQVPTESLRKFGNLSCASIPVAMCEQLAKAPESGPSLPLMLCGYGIGFSWASCIGDFKNVRLLNIDFYKPNPELPDRKEKIAYWHRKFTGENNNEQ